MKNTTQILEVIRQLSKAEQEQLVYNINKNLEDTEGSVAKLIEVKANLKEKEKFTCPHCKGEEVIGHGKYKGRKRYKCKSCKKTFNDLTGPSVSHIHKKDEWKSYLHCLAQNLSLRELAKEVGISLKTSFLWRHKIIGAFKDMGCTKLEGIIEGDETFFFVFRERKQSH